MLEAFIRTHDLDIILLQEVSQHIFTNFTGYTAHYNFGTTRRGTALITRDLPTLTNITPLPPERAIAAKLGDLSIINIYAPSGTSKRHEREAFFNNELRYLQRTGSDNLLMRGDFNYTLTQLHRAKYFQPLISYISRKIRTH